MRSRWGWGLGALAVLAAGWWWHARAANGGLVVELGAVETRNEFRSFVTASGEIVAERFADIGSSSMGRVVELPVVEGQAVREGDLLARIDPVQSRSELAAAEAGIRALEAEAGAAGEQLRSAEAELRLARARAREASLNRERIAALHAQELVSQADLEAAEASAAAAVSRVAGSGAAAERRVAQARAQAARARDLLAKTAIEAPIAGVVSRLQVRQGEMVVVGIQNQPGTVLMTVSDLEELNAEVNVAEADVLRVRTGQPARVTLEALPGRSFAGTVTEVGASALPQLGTGAAAREFRVEVRLEDPDPGMRPGLTCDAEILVGERDDVTTVPLQAVVLRLRGEGGTEARGVFVVEGGSARLVPVETGIIGGLDIEIRGVESGTEVVTGPYQVLRELNDGDRVRTR